MNLASPNDLRLSDAHRQACRHTLSSAALPEAHAEVLCRRRQRYKYVSVVERPQQCSDQQLEIAEGLSPRGLTYLCTEKAGYINSAPLLAPHTSGPRDVPRCGALSLLQKDAALQGGSSRNRC